MIAFKDTIFAYALYYPDGRRPPPSPSPWWSGSADSVCSLIGAVTIGMLAMFIQYSQRFWRPIQDLSDKYNILQAAMAACERIFKLLDTEPEIVSPAQSCRGRWLQPDRIPQRLVHVPETYGRAESGGGSSRHIATRQQRVSQHSMTSSGS